MGLAKILVSLLFICSASVAHAENGDNGRIIGGIIGGIVGGALGAGGFPHHPPYPYPGNGWPHRPHPPFPPGPFPPGPGPHPGPGPGPGPVDNLCVGTYQDSQGNAIRFSPQRDGNVYVEYFSNQNYSLTGWGHCYANSPAQTQFQFTLRFNGGDHVNSGILYFANDGRAYLQGNQDGGPTYYYSR